MFAGSRCRRQERMDNANQFQQISPKNDGENKVSFMGSVQNFFRTFGTQMDDSDHVVETHHEQKTFVNRLFRDIYAPFLLTTQTKIYVLFCYFIYLGIAIWGLSQIKEGLNPRNLVRSSFYLSEFYGLIDETFWQEGLQMQVVLNNPPDLFNETGRSEFKRLMGAFENTEYTMAHNATMIWWDAYESKLREDIDFYNYTWPERLIGKNNLKI